MRGIAAAFAAYKLDIVKARLAVRGLSHSMRQPPVLLLKRFIPYPVYQNNEN